MVSGDSIHRGDGRRDIGITQLHSVATSSSNMLGDEGINHAGPLVHPNFMQQTQDFQRGLGRDSIHRGDVRRDNPTTPPCCHFKW